MTAGASHRPTPLDVNFTFTGNRIFIIFSDMPHFVRRDIFAFAKVILRLCRSDILFTINTRKANITRLKAVYHCVAIELAVRRIELKKALAIASAFFWCERRNLNAKLRLPFTATIICPFCSAVLRKRWTNGFKPRGKCVYKNKKQIN